MTTSITMRRRNFLATVAGAGVARARLTGSQGQTRTRKPNIVLILADDLGYGDLGCYGHPEIRTPNVDRMAAEGAKFTSFYSASALCTPSRAGLLTGRYPVRSGLVRVLFPNETFGIPASEVTLGESLRAEGYATACIGKWHLGDLPQFHPTRHGFDFYYGLLYSNNMDPRTDHELPWPCPLSLYRNDEAIETPATQETLTARYTEQAVRFIQRNNTRPFFLYLPHSMPHQPWYASPAFKGRSKYGLYGDAIEEVDSGVGAVLHALRENNLEQNTLVVFMSDNGGAVGRGAASNGLLRGGKGSPWEGGFRVPLLARWPGRISPGTVRDDVACSMDLFTTLVGLAGGQVPGDRTIDGLNIWPVLDNSGPSPRRDFYYFNSDMDSDTQLLAVRSGQWKLHFRPANTPAGYFEPAALYNLERDPSEQYDQRGDEPEAVARLRILARQFSSELRPLPACPPLADRMLREGARKKRMSRQQMNSR